MIKNLGGVERQTQLPFRRPATASVPAFVTENHKPGDVLTPSALRSILSAELKRHGLTTSYAVQVARAVKELAERGIKVDRVLGARARLLIQVDGQWLGVEQVYGDSVVNIEFTPCVPSLEEMRNSRIIIDKVLAGKLYALAEAQGGNAARR